MTVRIGIVAIVAGAVFTLVPGVAAAAPFVFACKVHGAPGLVDPSHGQVVDLPVLVSPENGTANSFSAAITDSLVTWVDSSNGPSNAITSVLDRKRLVLGAYDNTGRLLMVGACVAPGEQSAAPLPSAPTQAIPVLPTPQPPPPPPRPQSLTLVCRLEELGPLMSGHNPSSMTSFLVDPGSGTVNGYPATITDTHISWKDAKNARADTWIIDRASGGIAAISSRNIPLLTGNCELSTARKF